MSKNKGINNLEERLAALERTVYPKHDTPPEVPGLFDLIRHLVRELSVRLPDLRELPKLAGYLNPTEYLRQIFEQERIQPARARFATLLQDLPAMKLAGLQPEELQILSLPPAYLTSKQSLADIVQRQTELFRELLKEKMEAAAREQRTAGTNSRQTRPKKRNP